MATVPTPSPQPAAAFRGPLLDALTALLADLAALAARARQYQWNVVGPQHPVLFELFRGQRAPLEDLIDRVAGRIRAVGGVLAADLPDLAGRARLPARPRQPDSREMVAGLLGDHEATANEVRVSLLACGADRVSADLLAGVLARLEESARVLRAMLEPPAGA